MTCYGTRHAWLYVALGALCVCGGYVWARDEVMPSGLCPRCQRPIDDHPTKTCPLNWPGKVAA